jgi:outer membrane lipoprotein-sorting protein
MAQIQPKTSGRKAVRYGIPAGVAGLAALTIGLVPALANTGAPDLPKISAEELLAKMAASDTQHMSGTVKISTDLGLPEMPGVGGGSGGKQGGGLFGGGPHGDGERGGGEGKGEVAAPQEKLMELASGEHTLRVAADGPDKQRVSLVEDASEYSFIHNGDEVWAYDSGQDAAFHAKAPEGEHREHGKGHGKGHGKDHGGMPGGGLGDVTPQKAAEHALKAAEDSTSVTVDGTAQVAGRDAYQLLIKPKDAPHSTVDSVRIAVDADNGTPLKFTLAPKGGGAPVVDVAYTKVDFGKPDASTFDFKPPKGTDVTEAGPHGKHGKHGKHGMPGKGVESEKLKELKKLDKLKKFEKGEMGEKGGEFGPFGKGEKGAGPGFSGLDTLGKGWGAVAELDMPKGAAGMPGAPAPGEDGKSGQGGQLLDSFSEKAEGDFGTGRVFSTRLVNALMTDDGKVYVGAVTKEGLIKAADAAAK